MADITITIAGPVGSGKTYIKAVCYAALRLAGLRNIHVEDKDGDLDYHMRPVPKSVREKAVIIIAETNTKPIPAGADNG